MKHIKVRKWHERPDNFTGSIENESGDVAWYLDGKVHREDGPAVIWENGVKSWYLDNLHYYEDEYNKEIAIRNSTLGKLLFKEPTFTLDET